MFDRVAVDLHAVHATGRPAGLPERPARQLFWWDLGGCDFDEVRPRRFGGVPT